MQTTLNPLLRKLLALSQRGATDGEREVARAKLDALLAREGVTLEQLLAPAAEVRQPRRFEVSKRLDISLLVQIVGCLLNNTEVEFTRHVFAKRTVAISADLTLSEYLEATALFAHYRKQMRRERRAWNQRFFSAFVHSAELTVDVPKTGEDQPLSEAEREELMALLAAARCMNPDKFIPKRPLLAA